MGRALGEEGTWHEEDGMKFIWLGLEYQVGRQARGDTPLGKTAPEHLI